MDLKLFICVVILITCSCNKIPSNLKKCNRNEDNFNGCLKSAVEDALSKGTVAVKEIGLPIVEPLAVPSLVIGAGTGPVAFAQNYKNVKVSGLGKVKCDKVEFDFDKKTLFLDCSTPQAVMNFDYEINGKILLLPIYGKGPGSITLENLNLKQTFFMEEYEKKGAKHYKITSNKLELTPKSMKFVLHNLFDGDKALGDNINQVMNDNWSEVFSDVKTSYEDAFGQIFAATCNQVLGKVSEEELFGEP